MIYATVNLLIREEECICDKVITLYRGDKNVQIRFVLEDNKFTIVDTTYAQMVIHRPHSDSIFTEISLMENNTFILTVTDDMIDELVEIGTYQFQIRLYDNDMTARVTLPPCNKALIIERPIVEGGESFVNVSRINDSTVVSINEYLDVFDENGDYAKTTWLDGDIITDVRLNKIEDALYDINKKTENNSKMDEVIEDIETIYSDIEVMKGEINEDIESIYSNVEVMKGEINEDIETIYSDIESMENEINTNINAEIESINASIESMENEINASIESMENEINANINAEIESINASIESIIGLVDKPPIYIQPTFDLTASVYNVEHDKDTSVTLTPNFVQNDAGEVTHFIINKNGYKIYEASLMKIHSDNVKLLHGESVIYDILLSYDDGEIKNSLFGVPYPQGMILSDSIIKNVTVTAYALSYHGVLIDRSVNKVDGLNTEFKTSKEGDLIFDLIRQRIVYMYPKSFGELTSIKDANGFEYINSYTLSTSIFNNVEYNIYILTDPITISNFRQIFR